MKAKIRYGLFVMFLAGLFLLCPRPWLTEFHVWGTEINLGFPLGAFSIQHWEGTQAEPGRLAVFPNVTGVIVDLLLLMLVLVLVFRRLNSQSSSLWSEQHGRMALRGKYRLLVFVGILLPMVSVCLFTFLVGPSLIGEHEAVQIGNALRLWFIVYLLVVVAVVIAKEVRHRKTK